MYIYIYIERCTIHDKECQRKILGFLKGMQTWQKFVRCMEEVKEKAPLTPYHEKAMEDQQYTQIWDVEKRCYHPIYIATTLFLSDLTTKMHIHCIL